MRRLLIASVVVLLGACGRGGTGTVEGTVSAPGGLIPGATVEAYLKPGIRTGEKPLSATVTDGNGRYSLPLPVGRYYLAARADNPGGGPRLTGAPDGPTTIGHGGDNVRVDIAVRARGDAAEGAATVPLTGRVVRAGAPVAGASIATYPPDHATFSGPGQLASGISGPDGTFSFPIPAVKQGVSVRLRTGLVKVGTLGEGDLSSGDPVMIEPRAGVALAIGDVAIHPVRSDRLLARRTPGAAGIVLEGSVADGEGNPLEGLYAMAYLNPDMTARPASISPPSGPDGRFRLVLPAPGTYYLGVRSRPGGPVTPGETMGSYQETPDHSITVGPGGMTGVSLTAERML